MTPENSLQHKIVVVFLFFSSFLVLEIVSLQSHGNSQQCTLKLTTKEDKQYRLSYTGQGITVQSLPSSSIVVATSVSSSSSTTIPPLPPLSTDSTVNVHSSSSLHTANETVANPTTIPSSFSSVTDSTDIIPPFQDQLIYDNLHTALQHLSKGYGDWYMEQICTQLLNEKTNNRYNNNRNQANDDAEDYDQDLMNNYLEECTRYHMDNPSENDDDDGNLEWDERLMYAAVVQKQQKEQASSLPTLHKKKDINNV